MVRASLFILESLSFDNYRLAFQDLSDSLQTFSHMRTEKKPTITNDLNPPSGSSCPAGCRASSSIKDSIPPGLPSRSLKAIDPPPVFKSWKGVYWLVIGFLLLQIVAYSILTEMLK